MKSDFVDETYFAAAFPLPFRVLALVGLGILGWATNLHGLHASHIDAAGTLDLAHAAHDGRRRRLASPLPTDRGWRAGAPPHRAVYGVFAAYTGCTAAAWLAFRVATCADAGLVDGFKFVPGLAMLCVLTALVCPFNVLHRPEREQFLQAVHRCLFPSPHRVYFSDVVFADIFTSFAKVLGDVWLSINMLMPGKSLLAQPSQDGLARWILPTLMSIPYAVRLRQCLVEFNAPGNESRRPLFNALKYASSFPVIYLSAAQRLVVSDVVALNGEAAASQPWHGEHQLFRLWLLAAAFNSLYTFWWDVTNDWGLDLLRPKHAGSGPMRSAAPPRPLLLPRLHSRSVLLKHPESPTQDDALEESTEYTAYTNSERGPHPYGLRPTLLFPLPVYPFAVLVDLVLRLTWSAKLSSHLHAYSEGDLVIFWIELAEVVRRWMWVFLRVEWETVKEATDTHVPRSPRADRGDSFRDGMVIAEQDELELGPSEAGGPG
ncbi:EXS-domain-containing protein [Lenzites betulinus]|nr:EXS-domain-containing protein [Lenzites betulinus]